jgi:hypothetical protein
MAEVCWLAQQPLAFKDSASVRLSKNVALFEWPKGVRMHMPRDSRF